MYEEIAGRVLQAGSDSRSNDGPIAVLIVVCILFCFIWYVVIALLKALGYLRWRCFLNFNANSSPNFIFAGRRCCANGNVKILGDNVLSKRQLPKSFEYHYEI